MNTTESVTRDKQWDKWCQVYNSALRRRERPEVAEHLANRAVKKKRLKKES